MSRRFHLIVSDTILNELQRALGKPYFTARLSTELILEFQGLVRSRATIVPISIDIERIVPDREDDHVLAAAVYANVDFLITGDHALRSIGSHRGVTIVTSREFVEIPDAN